MKRSVSAVAAGAGVPAALLLLCFVLLVPAAAGAQPPGGSKAATFGEVFPASTYSNFNVKAGGPPRIDLKDVIGKKPVVFCYWVPENTRSEEMLVEVQKAVDAVGLDKVALYGVVTMPLGVEGKRIAEWIGVVKERIEALKLHVPVLNDETHRIADLVEIRKVPSISVLDAQGRLRLANAGSLLQPLEYNMDVGGAIRRLASTGQLGTYGQLPTYYPSVELTGKKCPDFEAPVLGEKVPRSWSGLVSPDRVNVLIFWSVDCPHCRKALPEINAWLARNPAGVNVVTAANIVNDTAKTKTEEYVKQGGFRFKTFEDADLRVGNLFLVTSTPTTFIIRPDGVIDSVLFGEIDFPRALEQARDRILKPSRS